jgi:formate dehydrogenase major subunit
VPEGLGRRASSSSSPGRLHKVLYRRPHGTEWEELELETAMDMIAERVIDARERHWQERDERGWKVDRTLGFAHLGGATLDNEENYLIKKLWTAMARSRSRTRRAYDTPRPSPVWGPPSAAAAPRTSSRTSRWPTASGSRARR